MRLVIFSSNGTHCWLTLFTIWKYRVRDVDIMSFISKKNLRFYPEQEVPRVIVPPSPSELFITYGVSENLETYVPLLKKYGENFQRRSGKNNFKKSHDFVTKIEFRCSHEKKNVKCKATMVARQRRSNNTWVITRAKVHNH